MSSSRDSREKDLVDDLNYSARRGDLPKVKQLVEEKHVDVNARGECGYTALHSALVRRNRDVVAYLLERGADVNAATEDGDLPSTLCTSGGEADRGLLEMLLDASRRTGVMLRYGERKNNPLVLACQKNDVAWAAQLIKEFRFDCAQRCAGGVTAFHVALDSANVELVRLLLENGNAAEISLLDRPSDHLLPFEVAVVRDLREIGETLAYAFPPEHLAHAGPATGATALHLACEVASEESAIWWAELVLTRARPERCRELVDRQRKDGHTALHIAAKLGKWRLADRLLQENPRVDLPRNDGDTVFHMAFSGSPALVWKLLNEHKVDLSVARRDGSTPLILACDCGDEALAERIASMCPDSVNRRRADGMTALHFAVASGSRKTAEMLLAAGADVNARLTAPPASHGFDETILHLVLGPQSDRNYAKKFARRPDWALLFLDPEKRKGPPAQVDAPRKDGTTPLLIACSFGDMPVIRRLLELKANSNAASADGTCPLHVAYDKGHHEMCSLLLEAGANLSTPSPKRNGESVLHTALQRGDLQWVRIFLSKARPADFMAQRADRSIPLHVALESRLEKSVVEELIAKTSDINAHRANGTTALHLACQKGDLDAVRLLLKAGANPRAAAARSVLPLHLACAAGHAAIAKLLVSQGCDPTAVAGPMEIDEPEGNAIDLARRAGNFRLARMLMDPLRSSLAVVLHRVKLDDVEDEDGAGSSSAAAASAMMSEPMPGPLEDGTCSICGEEQKLLPLSRCGHKFCRGCLDGWFEAQYNGYQHPRCPFKDCGMIASHYDLRACMKNPAKYEEQALRKALMDIQDFRWCPKCGFGGIAPCGDAICEQCKFHFCAGCMLEKHDLSCAEHMEKLLAGERGKRKEARQAMENKESTKWIESFAKPCPSCRCNIKRSGGCSHMVCRNCKFEFCWICGGKYQGKYTFDNKCPCTPPKK